MFGLLLQLLMFLDEKHVRRCFLVSCVNREVLLRLLKAPKTEAEAQTTGPKKTEAEAQTTGPKKTKAQHSKGGLHDRFETSKA